MQNKKAVSEVVAYVLLISISLTLASIVFVWLKDYLPSDNSGMECEENVALVLSSVNYSCASGALNLTIQNRGFFDVDGYILRVNNISSATLGLYTLNKTGVSVLAGERYNDFYPLVNQTDEFPPKEIIGVLTLVEVQPIMQKNGKKVYCTNFVSKQPISC